MQYPSGARSSACGVNLPPRPPRLVLVKYFAKTRYVRQIIWSNGARACAKFVKINASLELAPVSNKRRVNRPPKK